jgi:hypothetical protein
MSTLNADTGITARIAGAPISWGVCEVPGWGGTDFLRALSRVLKK